MKRKNGFTLIEVIVSVVMVSIIMISLLSSLIQLKKTYSTIHENSDILVYSSSISRVINNDLSKNNGIRSITCAADGKSCDMILGNNSKRKIELLQSSIIDENYPKEKGKHENIKTTLKYTNPNLEINKQVLYIRSFELDKYTNKKDVVTTKGYSFLDLNASKTEYYDRSNEEYVDIYTTLIVRITNGKDEDIETNNIVIYSAGRYDFSQYNGKKYTIYLDPNGADGNYVVKYIDELFGVGFFESESIHDISTNHLRNIPTPTKTGFGFAGYYYKDNVISTEVLIIDSQGNIVANNRFFKEGIPSENAEDVSKPRVYAKWEKCENGYELKNGVCVPKDCNVVLNPGENATTEYHGYIVKYMQQIPKLTSSQLPYKDGHLFNGYYKSIIQYHDKDGKGKVQNIDYNDANNVCITLNATWQACPKGTFLRAKKDTNCIACVQGSYNATEGSSKCTACNNGKTNSSSGLDSCNENCSNNAHVKTWKTNTWNSETNKVNNICIIESCEDGYHLDNNKCLPNIYKITLNNQNATAAGTSEVWYEYNTTRKVNGTTCYYYTDSSLSKCLKDGHTISSPSKTSYKFGGYYTATNGNGTNYINSNGTFVNNLYKKMPKQINSSYDSTITLYAHWNYSTFTIKFNANGGSGAPSNQTATFNKDFTLSSTIPSRSDYTFITWNDPNGDAWSPGWKGKWTFTPGQHGITNNNELTLKAKWAKNQSDVIASVGNVNWGSTAFGFQVKINYGLAKVGNEIKGKVELAGYKGNDTRKTNYLNGTFQFGTKSYTFDCELLKTSTIWTTFTGSFGTGDSVTYSWKPNNSLTGNCHGKNPESGLDETFNTWTFPIGDTITVN